MSSEIKISLKITGNYMDFDEASAFIGLRSSKTLILENDYNRFPKYQWSIIADYSESESVDAKLQELFAQISNHEEKIVEYSSRNNLDVFIECNIRIHIDRPLYELSSFTVKKLSELDATFRMDIFDLSKLTDPE